MTPPCSRNVLHMVYVENLIYERLYVWLMHAMLIRCRPFLVIVMFNPDWRGLNLG